MSRQRQVVWYFAIVFLCSWAAVLPPILAPEWSRRVLGEFTLGSPIVILAVYMPSLTSIVLTAVFEGRSGLARLVRRLNPAGFNPVWYLIVLVGIPLLSVAGILVTGGRPHFVGVGASAAILAPALLMDPGPIGEEFGWRGYALPRLLESFSPFTATVILGVIWAIWHIPAFYLPGMPQSHLNLGVFILGATAVSMFQTWNQFATGGSILIAILTHLMANQSDGLVGGNFNGSMVGFAAAAVAIVWFDRRRFFGRPAAAPEGSRDH